MNQTPSASSTTRPGRAGLDSAKLFERVARRYRQSGRLSAGYVASKLKRDPVHRAILDLEADFGEVVDLGCGRGQLGILLLEAGRCRSVIGLDCNPRHLRAAEQAASPMPFTTELVDFSRNQRVPSGDTVVIVDVLYQLGSEAQSELVRAAAQAARQRLLIRTFDPARGLRSALTVAAERLIRRFSPNSGAAVNPMSIPALTFMLEQEGFAVSVTPCWQGTPFANVLVSALRLLPEGVDQ